MNDSKTVQPPFTMFPGFAGEIINRLGDTALNNSGDYAVGFKLMDVLIKAGICEVVSDQDQQ